jgi:alpha-D-xyloside xylohydrolase
MLAACAGDESVDPVPLAVRIETEGGYALRFELREPALVLVRAGDELTRIDGRGLALGTVDVVDDATSYDPWPLRTEIGGAFAPAGLAFRPAIAATVERADGDDFVVRLRHEGGLESLLSVESRGEGRFRASLVPVDASRVAYFQVGARVDTTERFYGLGETFDTVEHRGTVRAMQLEVDELESGNNEAHVPVPFVIGTRGWGLFVESSHPGLFDVAATEPERVDAIFGTGDASDRGLVFHLFGAERPLDVTYRYYETTGFPRLPAPWALGPLVWRDENDDQAQVEDDLRRMRELDLAATGIWIDRPYATAVNTFDFDPARFPDPEGMVARANDLGFRVALWHAPYLDVEADATLPLRAEAEAGGYYPLETGLQLNGWGPILDFTVPEAQSWWRGLLGGYTSIGIEGFKLDYGEDVVPGVLGARNVFRFRDGSDERTMHRGYTLLYHQTYATELPPEGGLLLCRAGKWGSQVQGPIIWPGDLDARMWKHREEVDEDGDTIVAVGGLPAAVVASVGLGPSGFPFFGSDTGGYRHAPPDVETFRRWFEHTALSSVMQIGTSSNDVAWEFGDDELLESYRFYTRLHLRLFPYLWSYADAIERTGRPIQRPFGLVHPELGLHPSDVYFLGDALLVAPVTEPGVTERTVPLPPGSWVDFWSGLTVVGTVDPRAPVQVTVAAPLGFIPLFQRAGSLLPMLRPSIDTLVPVDDPLLVDSFASKSGPLWVRTSPGDEGRIRLYDGTRLAQEPIDGGMRLSSTPGSRFAGDAVFEVVSFGAAPADVLVDGQRLSRVEGPRELEVASEGWTFDDLQSGTVRVKLLRGTHTVEIRR